MQHARMIGYRVQKYADAKQVQTHELGTLIDCSDNQMKSFYKGRAFVSFDQLVILANHLGVSVSDFLAGSEDDYNRSVVHCMNGFEDPANREKILDIIDAYLDICDSITD